MRMPDQENGRRNAEFIPHVSPVSWTSRNKSALDLEMGSAPAPGAMRRASRLILKREMKLRFSDSPHARVRCEAHRTAAGAAALPKQFNRAASAFTLIEIMIVVAIMAIILAAGIPSLYGFFHKHGLRKTTGDIVEVCQSARASAILTGSATDLIFHPRDGICETSSSGGGYGAWAHSAKIENCAIEMLDVNLQECKDFDTVKVRFFPNGTCDEMTLILRSNENEWRKITLEITTALPSISDRIQ